MSVSIYKYIFKSLSIYIPCVQQNNACLMPAPAHDSLSPYLGKQTTMATTNPYLPRVAIVVSNAIRTSEEYICRR